MESTLFEYQSVPDPSLGAGGRKVQRVQKEKKMELCERERGGIKNWFLLL